MDDDLRNELSYLRDRLQVHERRIKALEGEERISWLQRVTHWFMGRKPYQLSSDSIRQLTSDPPHVERED